MTGAGQGLGDRQEADPTLHFLMRWQLLALKCACMSAHMHMCCEGLRVQPAIAAAWCSCAITAGDDNGDTPLMNAVGGDKVFSARARSFPDRASIGPACSPLPCTQCSITPLATAIAQ